MALQIPRPKALFFDVFGTCVDWRSSVTRALSNHAKEALHTRTDLKPELREKVAQMTDEDWGDFAQAWRSTYYAFTRKLAADPSQAYKTVDEHYLDSLRALLAERGLLHMNGDAAASLYSEKQTSELALVWHFLDPWPEAPSGLAALHAAGFTTTTLSNGNVALLDDLVRHGRLPFTYVFSAEMFRSYKPNPAVYLGAVEKLGLRPDECGMVAAHLDDLKHAKQCGLRTVYVEREREERCPELRGGEGIVDVWVGLEEDGFLEVARRLGGDGGSGK